MKKIMILGASILQLPAIQEAINMGLQVIAVDMNPNAIGFEEIGVCQEVVSTIDIPAVIEVAKKHKVDAVLTLASDMPMRTVAAVARELGLVGISDEAAIKATNKFEMRKSLAAHGVPVPNFFCVSSVEEYKKVLAEVRYPFIVKPADNSGSRGIVKIEEGDDFSQVLEAYTYSLASSRNGDVVVEEYMDGSEVSVEALAIDGNVYVIQITDKLTTGAPHFVEMGHSQPSNLPDKTIKEIKRITVAANKAIGIENGPSHTEIIITNEGPKIVEIGARLGGDCITTHLVPLSTGVNMVKCCIKIALGENVDIKQLHNKGAAIRYFAPKPGRVKAILGIEDALKIEGVEQVSIVHGVGERVTEIIDSSSRMGFVIAKGEDANVAIRNCYDAAEKIKIEIDTEV